MDDQVGRTARAAGSGVLDRAVAVPSGGAHEEIYRAAAGDLSRVPWARGGPDPLLVAWLNREAPGTLRPGARAVVVGCGLGDDVVELLARGYDAIGFDVAPTAIDWARQRFPEHARSFVVGDLFTPQSRWRHRFDAVVEAHTLQSIEPHQRERAARSLADLSCPRGAVLTICRGREEGAPLRGSGGPPWPLTRAELIELMAGAGLRPTREVDELPDDHEPGVRRLRAAFVHA